MLNHTTLLFAPNLPGIKWNINKFALIITQKSPDNHTISAQFFTFTAFIHQLLIARKYCLWFWRLQRQFASVSIILFWITEELTNSKVLECPPCDNCIGTVVMYSCCVLSASTLQVLIPSFKSIRLLQFHHQNKLYISLIIEGAMHG